LTSDGNPALVPIAGRVKNAYDLALESYEMQKGIKMIHSDRGYEPK
jgi:hypothetical protein